jgi:eukaryotic-like serine/threonine-protein kinase
VAGRPGQLDPIRPILQGLATSRQIPRLLGKNGRFAVKRPLGSGASSEVFVAEDRQQHQLVALKVLSSAARKAGGIERFRREFAALRAILHPNVARHYELFEDKDVCFFSLELVEGPDWISHVRADVMGRVRGGTRFVACSAAGLRRLGRTLPQLVAGVARAHESGLVHGDLRPDNVRVTYSGRVVVLDYGVGVGLESDRDAAVGTPAYMAPEQWQHAARSPASDWYSVGVMLFEALTGTLPFSGTGEEVLLRKRTLNAPRPSSLVGRVPAVLDELCEDLLHTDPAQRPDAAALLELMRGPAGATGPARS